MLLDHVPDVLNSDFQLGDPLLVVAVHEFDHEVLRRVGFETLLSGPEDHSRVQDHELEPILVLEYQVPSFFFCEVLAFI